jgi:hypothetical protein
MGKGGLLERKLAVDHGLKLASVQEAEQRCQVLPKPIWFSALQHLNAVDQEPFVP